MLSARERSVVRELADSSARSRDRDAENGKIGKQQKLFS